MRDDHDVRLSGLARNSAAPPEILLRLLGLGIEDVAWTLCGRAELPDELLGALLAHPDVELRKVLAMNLRLGPETRSRLADDPDMRVRGTLVEHCSYRHHVPTLAPRAPLTVEAYERLAADTETRIREEVALQPYTPDHVRARLATDPSSSVRILLADHWKDLRDEVRTALLNDPDAQVRHEARRKQEEAQVTLLPRALAEDLARNPDARTRAAAAANPRLPEDLAAELGRDPDPAVRLAASTRPGLSEAQRAAIDYHDDPNVVVRPLAWVLDQCEDEQTMAECALSAHPVLRRSAACCPHLPPDLVDRLAADDDFVVRLFLAENHPSPPGQLLLRTVLEFDGWTVDKMLNNPNFPRVGLQRFVGSANPRERELVVLDPTARAETIERLSHDDDPRVRAAMARDPRLSLVRIRELLGEPDTAGAAAANPMLPVDTMSQIIDDAATQASWQTS